MEIFPSSNHSAGILSPPELDNGFCGIVQPIMVSQQGDQFDGTKEFYRVGPGLAQRPEFPRAVFHEASSKIIAWSTPAKLAGNIRGPARKLLVWDLDERWNSVSCKVMK